MKKLRIFAVTFVFVLTMLASLSASAETYDNWTFEINEDGETLTITDYTGSGDVVVPTEIFGKKVTAITDGVLTRRYVNATSFSVEEGSEFTAVDGVLFNKDGTVLIAYPNAKEDTEYFVPEGVKTGDKNSFLYSLVKKVHLSSSVENADFLSKSTLTEISVDDNNEHYTSDGGILFSKDKKELVRYPTLNADEQYIVPESVVKVDDYAFFNSKFLKKIVLPENAELGIRAFCNCEILEDIDLPDALTGLGEGMFSGCYSLKNITIPQGVTKIGARAFWSCSFDEIKLPDGVMEIGESAFKNCHYLKAIEIPNGVTKIAENTFENCIALEDISLPDGVTEIGYAAFRNCNSLEYIVIPQGVASLNKSSFTSSYSSPDKLYVFIKGMDTTVNLDDRFVICCYENSAAHNFAKENGIDCEFFGNAPFLVKNRGNIRYTESTRQAAIPLLAQNMTEEQKEIYIFTVLYNDGKISGIDVKTADIKGCGRFSEKLVMSTDTVPSDIRVFVFDKNSIEPMCMPYIYALTEEDIYMTEDEVRIPSDDENADNESTIYLNGAYTGNYTISFDLKLTGDLLVGTPDRGAYDDTYITITGNKVSSYIISSGYNSETNTQTFTWQTTKPEATFDVKIGERYRFDIAVTNGSSEGGSAELTIKNEAGETVFNKAGLGLRNYGDGNASDGISRIKVVNLAKEPNANIVIGGIKVEQAEQSAPEA